MTDAPTTDRWIRQLNLLQLVLAGIIIMTPTVWMVLSSLKPSFEVTAYPPTLIFSPTLENYVQLMKTTPFLQLRRQQPDRDARLDERSDCCSEFPRRLPCHGRGFRGRRS